MRQSARPNSLLVKARCMREPPVCLCASPQLTDSQHCRRELAAAGLTARVAAGKTSIQQYVQDLLCGSQCVSDTTCSGEFVCSGCRMLLNNALLRLPHSRTHMQHQRLHSPDVQMA